MNTVDDVGRLAEDVERQAACAFAIGIDRGDDLADAAIDLEVVDEVTEADVGLGRRDGFATAFGLVAIASLAVMGGVIGKSICLLLSSAKRCLSVLDLLWCRRTCS